MQLNFEQYDPENWVSQVFIDGGIYSITKGSSSEGSIYLPVYHTPEKEIWLDEKKSLDEAKAAAQRWENEHNTKEKK
jgi:hypothetical protein